MMFLLLSTSLLLVAVTPAFTAVTTVTCPCAGPDNPAVDMSNGLCNGDTITCITQVSESYYSILTANIWVAEDLLSFLIITGYQQPPPCLQGQACRHINNRSYMNNTVFCCPNGLGLSVMSNGYSTHCACGNNNYISVEGQRISSAMRRRMQRFQENFQAQMAAFNRQMSNMSRNLANMFRGGFW